MQPQDKPLIIEQTYHATIDKVWAAITDLDFMRQWYFQTLEAFKPEVGFETRFNVEANNKNYTHIWKVTQVLAGSKISYEWVYESYPGHSIVSWELRSEKSKTKLKMTQTGLESFPQDNPDFARESWIEGWDFLIHQSLKEFLDKKEE